MEKTEQKTEILATEHEPKRQFRWVLHHNDIPAFMIKKIYIPTLKKVENYFLASTPFEIEIYSVPGKFSEIDVFKILAKKQEFVKLDYLNKDGVVIDTIMLSGTQIDTRIDISELKYDSNEVCTIKLYLHVDKVKFFGM